MLNVVTSMNLVPKFQKIFLLEWRRRFSFLALATPIAIRHIECQNNYLATICWDRHQVCVDLGSKSTHRIVFHIIVVRALIIILVN